MSFPPALRLPLLALAALLPACSVAATASDPGAEHDASLALRVPRRFALDPVRSQVRLRARDGAVARVIALPIVAGAVDLGLYPDGSLEVDALDVELADVMLAEATVPHAPTLTGMRVSLSAPAVGKPEVAEPELVAAELVAPAQIDWSIRLDGDVVPLPTIRLPALPVALAVTVDGDLTLDLSAHHDGSMWSWLTYELGDAELDLVGTAAP